MSDVHESAGNAPSDPANRDAIARARASLGDAGRVVVLTGAGISAESGVPTFRGAEGLWRRFRPEDLATPEAFARDPRLVWEWYDWRRSLIAAAEPNAGHRALVQLEETSRAFSLVTQNVDGLHRLAGSRRRIELHGDLWILRCTRCGRSRENRTVPLRDLPPRCACGGIERPGVVWFGEPLPEAALADAVDEARKADVLLVVGTSAVVQPAAGIAFETLANGGALIEVNPDETAITPHATISIRGRAGEVLPRLVERLPGLAGF